jgi:GNAT superfamily N-acetyltransferase
VISLSETGAALLREIDRFANLQVGRALHSLKDDKRQTVIEGLRAYADALARMPADRTQSELSEPVIVEGFRPGAIGRITEIHGRYYGSEWAFPPLFEARVAAGLADFVPRLGRDGNQIWLALSGSDIRGSAAIDGEDLGAGKAHLRWVIVEDDMRGTGIGRRLVAEAVNFCDQRGFAEIHLWTFKGLDAARHLYESFGFVLAEEWLGNQWGTEVVEQRFVRRR